MRQIQHEEFIKKTSVKRLADHQNKNINLKEVRLLAKSFDSLERVGQQHQQKIFSLSQIL